MGKRTTDQSLQRLKPPATGRLEIQVAAGLFFRLTAGGVASWVCRYSVKGKGAQQRVTLDAFNRVNPEQGMTLAQAMEKAAAIISKAKGGIDLPERERREKEEAERAARAPKTVADLCRRYIEDYASKKQRRWKLVEKMFDQHVVPFLGDRDLAELRRAEVVEFLDHLEHHKGFKAQVNRVRSQLIAALNWAVERDFIDSNPAATVKRRRDVEAPRERVLSDIELKAIWEAADKLPPPSRQFVQALILTGQRRDEVRCMTWAEIKGDIWTLPKVRNKGKRDHAVPLVPAMQAVLESLPRIGADKGGPVFTLNGSRPYAGTKRLKEILDRESGVTGWTLHDIRRTVRTRLSRLGVPGEVSEQVLNHAKDKLEKTYDRHDYLDEKRDALGRWADYVASVVGVTPSNVVSLDIKRAGGGVSTT